MTTNGEIQAKVIKYRRYLFRLAHVVRPVERDGVQFLEMSAEAQTLSGVFLPLLQSSSSIVLVGDGWRGQFGRSLHRNVADEIDRFMVQEKGVVVLKNGFDATLLMPFFFGCLRAFNSWVPVVTFSPDCSQTLWSALFACVPRGFPSLYRGPMYARAERRARTGSDSGTLTLIFEGEDLVHYFPKASCQEFAGLFEGLR